MAPERSFGPPSGFAHVVRVFFCLFSGRYCAVAASSSGSENYSVRIVGPNINIYPNMMMRRVNFAVAGAASCATRAIGEGTSWQSIGDKLTSVPPPAATGASARSDGKKKKRKSAFDRIPENPSKAHPKAMDHRKPTLF
jgi:hypothetical protein